jgi:transcriptional regulator with XRE-family HTH domain
MNNLTDWYSMSDRAMLQVLGDFIRQTRLKQNKTQEAVSGVAGINRSTLVQMEKGKGGTLLSFIQVLRALEQFPALAVFEVKQELSPLQLAAMEMKKRQRARKKAPSGDKPKSTW